MPFPGTQRLRTSCLKSSSPDVILRDVLLYECRIPGYNPVLGRYHTGARSHDPELWSGSTWASETLAVEFKIDHPQGTTTKNIAYGVRGQGV